MESVVVFDNTVIFSGVSLSNSIISEVASISVLRFNIDMSNNILFDLAMSDLEILGTFSDVLGTITAFETLDEDKFDAWENLDDIGAWL